MRICETKGMVRLACLAASLTLLAGSADAQDTSEKTPTSPSSPGHLHVEVADGIVTVKATHVTVKDVLEEIARQSSLILEVHDPLDQRVNMELDRLRLLEALDIVLLGQNIAMRYFDPSFGAASSSPGRSSRLWVFSRGPGDDHAPPETGDAVRTGDGVEDPEALEGGERPVGWRVALADDDAKVRLKAVSELAGGDSDQAAVLAAAALFDEDSSVRAEAVHGLGEIGDKSGLWILEQALTDPDHKVRRAAVEAVADIGGDDSARALATVLNDQDDSVREEAVYALGEIGGRIALGLLKKALADARISIQESAAEILAELSRQKH